MVWIDLVARTLAEGFDDCVDVVDTIIAVMRRSGEGRMQMKEIVSCQKLHELTKLERVALWRSVIAKAALADFRGEKVKMIRDE